MDAFQRRQWLVRGAVLAVVFVGAVSMDVQRLRGWGFFILCLVLGSVGGLGAMWGVRQVQQTWNQMSSGRRALLVGAVAVFILAASFILNYGRPQAAFNDFLTVLCLIVVLLFWALSWLLSWLFAHICGPRTSR